MYCHYLSTTVKFHIQIMSKNPTENLCSRYVKNSKKSCIKSNKIPELNSTPNDNTRNQEIISNASKAEQDTISKLMIDLAQVLTENVKLSNTNTMLKVDIEQSNDKIKALENTLNEERGRFNTNLQDIQQRLLQTEYLLRDKERQLFKESETSQTKISTIKATYFQEKDLAIIRENNLQNEIDNLKRQMGKNKANMEDLSNQLKKAKEKISAYKEKLKFCVNLITEMNTFLSRAAIKESASRSSSEKASQTNERLVSIAHKDCNCRGCSLECEHIVLSDLFFKENALKAALDDVLFSLNDYA